MGFLTNKGAVMAIAVTGAAGYPGSHMLLCLAEAGEGFLPIDSSGVLVPSLMKSHSLMTHRFDDAETLAKAFKAEGITEVIHFAGGGTVEQSINDPLTYYQNNTAKTLILMAACKRAGVERLVLSSTASVYGVPDRRCHAGKKNTCPFLKSLQQILKSSRDFVKWSSIKNSFVLPRLTSTFQRSSKRNFRSSVLCLL